MPSIAESAPVAVRTDDYQVWRKNEGAPLVGGIYVRDMKAVAVGDWPRKGVKGALLYLDGDDEMDEHLVEIPPGGSTIPERHLYDEEYYVVSGRGTCSVWYDEKRKQVFEWGEGSFFALPTNINYQFFNGSGTQPARYFSVTNLPGLLRQFGNADFLFHNTYTFDDRYTGDADYFSGEGKLYRGRLWETNFIPDVRKMRLWEWKERGGGGTNAFFMLAGGRLEAHISRFQTGTYKKGHRHGSTMAHLYICQGEGYAMVKRGDDEDRIKCDWQEGSLYLPGAGEGLWLHQHFNVGMTPAAYLVMESRVSRRLAQSRWTADIPTDWTRADKTPEEGGIQTEYEQEDPEIHRIFEEELRKRGIQCRMKNLVPWCTGIEGPTQKGEWGDE